MNYSEENYHVKDFCTSGINICYIITPLYGITVIQKHILHWGLHFTVTIAVHDGRTSSLSCSIGKPTEATCCLEMHKTVKDSQTHVVSDIYM